MIARGAKYLAAAIALVVVLAIVGAIAAASWVLHTESGSAWAWERIRAAVPGELGAADVAGTFTDGLRIEGLTYAHPALAVTAGRLRLAVDPDLFPPSVTVGVLEAGEVVVRLGERQEPPAPEHEEGFTPDRLALPARIVVEDLRLEDLRVVDARGNPVFALERAALAGRWHEAIVVSRLELASPVTGDIEGSAALSLRAPYDANASLAARYPLEVGGETVPFAVAAAASGDLRNLRVRLDGREPDFVVEGRLLDLLEAPEWTLEARSPALEWPLRGPEPAVGLRDVLLESSGRASDYTLSGGGTLLALDGRELALEMHGTGNTGGIELERLRLNGPILTADARGAVGWARGFAVRVDASVGRFDPSTLMPQWPADASLEGRVAGGFRPGKLELDDVQARVRGTEQAVAVRGLVDLAAGVVDVELDWQNLRWPVAGPTFRLASETGDLSVSGRPEDWTLAGGIALSTPELPPGTFVLSGEGSREAATFQIEDSAVLGGTLAGRVDYAQPGGGRWTADLSAAGIDVGALLAEWPGRLDAELTATGRLEPLELAVDVERLAGALRNRPLTGSGGFRWANGNLAFERLSLASGDARLRANGSLRAAEGLAFAVELPSLGALVRQAAGSLTADGTVSLAGDFPRAELRLTADELGWRDWRVASLGITAREGDAPLVVDMDAHGLDIAGVAATRVTAELAASASRQRLSATAVLDEKEIELALAGRLADWRRPLESPWSGSLEALAVSLSEDLHFELEEPAGITLGQDRVALERACLAGDDTSRICLAGSRDAANAFEASADAQALPLGIVKTVLDTELEFTQTLDGSLTLGRRPGQELSATARVDFGAGRIHNPAYRDLALATRAGTFRLDLQDGQVLLTRLNLPVAQGTAIDAEFTVEDVARGEDSPIGGKLLVTMDDVGVLTPLVPSLERAAGRLAVDLALGGTVAEPAVTGTASLNDGSALYAPLGLDLRDIELTSRIGPDNRIDLQSSFRAGEGTGRLYSSTNGLGAAADEVRLHLSGDDLTVVELPQVNVIADMDVGVGITPGQLMLDGRVRIPRARLSPQEIASTRVSESEDVVIVASRNGEEEAETERAAPLAIFGEVDLTLGDDVVIDFDAAQTRLSGAVTFDWNGQPMPIATGEYEVAGRFEAYGQLLEITEGSIRFPEVPATNPQLRIRAEREIFGNPRIRSAGVLVSGTARNPEIDVYTSPETNRERALTLLVTGSDFDYEQGVGAVDVGTYIAPDLYLSYGIGLFDRENVVSVRYDFTRGFGIKATSGKSTEGVDLSYTFER